MALVTTIYVEVLEDGTHVWKYAGVKAPGPNGLYQSLSAMGMELKQLEQLHVYVEPTPDALYLKTQLQLRWSNLCEEHREDGR